MTISLRLRVAALGLGLSGGCALGQTAPAVAPSTAAPKAQPTTIEATPALWKVKGLHGTVYLFGSVHVMKPEVQWRTAKEQAAFKASDTLYLEIADLSNDAAKQMQPLILSLGIDAVHPLSTKISKEDVTELDSEVKKLGMQGEAALESMQPWLVYLTLSVLPAIQAGYDPASGIDRVLQIEAQQTGKKIKGFETTEQQVHFLADFSQPEQVALLHETLEELPRSGEKINQMIADWEHGDVDKIAAMENDELKTKHPELYQKLLVDRNAKISTTIASLLKDPATGTVFIAIGAAHLAGPDSVQKMLEKSGFIVAREE